MKVYKYKVDVDTACDNAEKVFHTHFNHKNRRYNYAEDWETFYLTAKEIKECIKNCVSIKMRKI